MNDLNISWSNRVMVDQRRLRQTPKPESSFKQVLRGGAQVLLSGAATATRVVGMPILSAAISRVNANVGQIDGSAPMLSGGLLNSGLSQQIGGDQVSDDMKLLALQDAIQQHDRQITLLSNVMKARHEAAKAAIGNIRA